MFLLFSYNYKATIGTVNRLRIIMAMPSDVEKAIIFIASHCYFVFRINQTPMRDLVSYRLQFFLEPQETAGVYSAVNIVHG